MKLSHSDRETLKRLEEELWREEYRFDQRRMGEVLAEDFFEFGRSGRVYQREDTLTAPREPFAARLPLQNFRVRLLAPDVAQVTYNSAVTYDGGCEYGRRSSIWTRGPTGWLLRFHQGTPYDSDA
jgi:hypothetical protein